MSATHRWFGFWALKSWFSRLGATGRLWSELVVALYLRAALARRAFWRIRRATRFFPTRRPPLRSAQVMRGEPTRPLWSSEMRRMACKRSSSASVRGGVGRSRHS